MNKMGFYTSVWERRDRVQILRQITPEARNPEARVKTGAFIQNLILLAIIRI